MALYSLHTSAVGRGQKKSSAVQAAAYQARESLYDRVTQETYYSSEKRYGEILAKTIYTPPGSPSWAKDRKELWTQAEEKDSRKNSRFAKSFILGLQDELTLKQNKSLLSEFIKKNFANRGLVVDIAIHAPSKKGDKRNVHAHLLVSTRAMTQLGWGEKDRGIDKKDFLNGIRQSWAEEINNALKAAGRPERVSHKSLADRGIARDPQQHMGAAATAIQRKGIQPDRGKGQLFTIAEVKEALSANQPGKEKKMETGKNVFEEIKEFVADEYPNGKGNNKFATLVDVPAENVPAVVKAKKEKTKSVEFLFCEIMYQQRPYIVEQLKAEGLDLVSRKEKKDKGTFDEFYDKDKKIFDKTRDLYNSLSEVKGPEEKDHRQWKALHDSMYNDPFTKQPFFNFKYSNSRYTIWTNVNKKFQELRNKFFPPKPQSQDKTTGRDAAGGRKDGGGR